MWRVITGISMVAATLARGQTPARLGDVAFAVPKGWSAAADSEGMKLMPAALPAGSVCLVVLRQADSLGGDFAAWFQRSWASVLRAGTVLESSPPQKQQLTGTPNEAMTAAAVLQDAQRHTLIVLGFGIRDSARAVPVLWIVSRRELLTQYVGAVHELLHSVRLSNTVAQSGVAGDSTSPPAAETVISADSVASGPASGATSSTLDGPYMGLYMGFGLGQYVYATHVKHRILVFFPDGSVIYAPERGLAGFDVKTALRSGTLDPDMSGRYARQDGGSVIARFPKNFTLKFTIDDNGTSPGLDQYIPLCKCTGLRLDGTFKITGTQYLMSFGGDGRFVDRSGAIRELLQYSFADEERKTGIVGYGEKITQPGSGTYQIVNNTIILSYTDGRRIATSFFAPARAGTGTPPWFLIHDMNLEPIAP